MTATAQKTILCFGDSNTHGTCAMRFQGDTRRLAADRRWTGHLKTALPASVTLIEEGHPGRTTVHDDPIEGVHKNGLTVLPALLESHRPIDLVILMLGTNDLKARFSVTATDIARSIDRLCGVIAASASGPDNGAPKLLIVCPPPILETGCLAGIFEGGTTKSKALAPLVAGVAEARDAGFLDAGQHMGVSTVDGIHFDENGHAALGAVIAKTVVAMVN